MVNSYKDIVGVSNSLFNTGFGHEKPWQLELKQRLDKTVSTVLPFYKENSTG